MAKVKDSTVEGSSIRSIACQMAVHADAICVLTVAIFSALLFFANLGSGPLWAADERTYSQWGFYMAKTGDYLNPWAFGEPSLWIGKPPLYFWLMALSYQVFGVSNFSTRFWSPVFGVLSCVVVFYLGKKLYNRSVGLFSVLVLSTFFTFYSFARHAMLDVPLVFFMLTSIYFFILSQDSEKDRRFAILGGLFFGLALMTKQTNALLVPLILGLYLVVTKRKVKALFSKRLAVFVCVGLLVIIPWLIYMNLQFGQRFWYVYLLYNNLMRSMAPLEGHVGGVFFYFEYLATSENLFWMIILPIAVAFSVFNSFFKRRKEDALLLVWMAVVIGVFTLAQTKLYWYILPVFPAFAISIGNFLYVYFKKLKFVGLIPIATLLLLIVILAY